MRALHRDTLTCWRELLGDALYHDLIRPSGQVHVWEGDDASPTEAIEQQIRDRHGIAAQQLNADDLRQMFPGLARDITRGLFVPGNGYTVSPQRIVHSLAELFRAAGGDDHRRTRDEADPARRRRLHGDDQHRQPQRRPRGGRSRRLVRANCCRRSVFACRWRPSAAITPCCSPPACTPRDPDQQQDARLLHDADGGRAARGRHGGDRRPRCAAR